MVTERLEIENQEIEELKCRLAAIDWKIDYGSVKIQIRAGKVTLVTVEKTMRLD